MLWDTRSPSRRPVSPTIAAPSNGASTMAWTMRLALMRSLPLHHVGAVDGDIAAIAEVGDDDGQAHGGLGRGHGEHEHGVDLPGHLVQVDREGHQIDVHG